VNRPVGNVRRGDAGGHPATRHLGSGPVSSLICCRQQAIARARRASFAAAVGRVGAWSGSMVRVPTERRFAARSARRPGTDIQSQGDNRAIHDAKDKYDSRIVIIF